VLYYARHTFQVDQESLVTEAVGDRLLPGLRNRKEAFKAFRFIERLGVAEPSVCDN
jgi:hypothetical protein